MKPQVETLWKEEFHPVSAVILGTPEGKILDHKEWLSEASRGPEAMLRDFLKHANLLLEAHGEIEAVGVSIGGPLDMTPSPIELKARNSTGEPRFVKYINS